MVPRSIRHGKDTLARRIFLVGMLILWIEAHTCSEAGLMAAAMQEIASAVDSTSAQARAGTKRALLVGINVYQPDLNKRDESGGVLKLRQRRDGRVFTNLHGPLNDIEAMRQLLIARYGFEQTNIGMLRNEEATRNGIFAALEDLIDVSDTGDVAVFMFAGHGSQVLNRHSAEHDRKDESIVPADAYKGARDIRDKELAVLFNRLLDKGALPTLIFDCCHSGSMSREVFSDGLTPRALEPAVESVPWLPPPSVNPVDRGALTLSASQDYQYAWPLIENGQAQGAFASALIKSLRSSKPGESAQNIFLRTHALMQTYRHQQEPVLEGLPERRLGPLFGTEPAGSNHRPLVAATSISTANESLTIQGGLALGLNKGCVLRMVRDSSVMLRVTDARHPAFSTARVQRGEIGRITVGDLFEIVRWTVANTGSIRIWLPAAYPEELGTKTLGKEIRALQYSRRLQWITDPARQLFTHLLYRDDESWILSDKQRRIVLAGDTLSAARVLKELSDSPIEPRLFAILPPAKVLYQQLFKAANAITGLAEFTSHRDEADYHLLGRSQNDTIAYALLQAGVFSWNRPGQGTAILPRRSAWVSPDTVGVNECSRLLSADARRLAAARMWLRLESPPSSGEFPYQLALYDRLKGTRRGARSTVEEGERFQLLLHADRKALRNGCEQRFVYVFAMDSHGKRTLLFPNSMIGNVENRFPVDNNNLPQKILLSGRELFKVAPPFGMDTFFLLTSREALVYPGILDSKGIGEREPRASADFIDPLSAMFEASLHSGRSALATVPLSWSIDRFSVTSVPKQNAK